MARRPGPVRTCVGCRQRAAAADLLRIVAAEDRLVPDPRRRLPGRGAHLHPVPECLALAERRRAFPRALRLPGPLDGAAVHELLAEPGAGRTALPRSTRPGPPGPGDEEAGRVS